MERNDRNPKREPRSSGQFGHREHDRGDPSRADPRQGQQAGRIRPGGGT
jgi:hypothetical protein